MNLKTLILFCCCFLIISCKTKFIGKNLNYTVDDNSEFKLIFVNDSILEIKSKSEYKNSVKAVYKYELSKKETLEKIKKNQHYINFKTKKLYGQYMQDITIELIDGQISHLNKIDTLNFLKMRIEGNMTKRIYLNSANTFIEL